MPVKKAVNNDYTFLLIILIAASVCQACRSIPAGYNTGYNSYDNIFAAENRPRRVSKQFAYDNVPASERLSNQYFSSQPNNDLHEYPINENLTVYIDNTGRSTSTYYDRNGHVITSPSQNYTAPNSKRGKSTVIVRNIEERHIYQPDDVTVLQNRNVYYTDPNYKYTDPNYKYADPDYRYTDPNYRGEYTTQAQPVKNEQVYRIPNNKKRTFVTAKGVQKPNAMIATPDGKYLYVADMQNNKTYKYQVNDDGSLYNPQVFANQGSEGMTMDNKGNIYLTGDGVSIYNPQGNKIDYINVPAKRTSNVSFGGKNKNKLYITSSDSIYVMNMDVKGAQ